MLQSRSVAKIGTQCTFPYILPCFASYRRSTIYLKSTQLLKKIFGYQFSSVTQLCLILCTPGLPVHHQLLESTQTHVHCVGDAIQPSHPLLPPSAPALNLSQHQGFSNEADLCIRWPKYWSFSFTISLSSEYSGLISFRID